MTESSGSKRDYEIDFERIQRLFSEEFEGVDLHIVTHRPGTTRYLVLEATAEDSSKQLFAGGYLTEDRFEHYLAGMKAVARIAREAKKQRRARTD